MSYRREYFFKGWSPQLSQHMQPPNSPMGKTSWKSVSEIMSMYFLVHRYSHSHGETKLTPKIINIVDQKVEMLFILSHGCSGLG